MRGGELLDQPGPVLLIPNHVSWLDWIFLGISLDEDWRFVTSNQAAEMSWIHRKIMRSSRTFPVEVGSPYGMKEIISYLKGGGRLVLFAEGRLTKTGSLMKMFEGTGFLIQKSGARILTGYLRGIKRIKWVQHDGWTKLFPQISLHIREAQERPNRLENLKPTEQRARLTAWMTREMMKHRFEVELSEGEESLPNTILKSAKERPEAEVFQDVTMQTVNYKKLILGADLIGREISKHLHQDERRLGILLPNVNANPVSLLASWFQGRVPTLLNYTSGPSIMVQCSELAGLKHIVTSRTFLEKAKIDAKPFEDAEIELLYLEDLKEEINGFKKLSALCRFKFEPELINKSSFTRKDTAIILFTSGSEGVPKGVELSHENFIANIEQVLSVTDIMDKDRIFNPLPLFHSFGLTIGTILPLMKGIYSFLYPNPLSYKAIPSVVYGMDCTITMGTNTFLSQYGKNAHAIDFRNIRYIFAGAEKLQDTTFDLWNEKFGVRILQGYGATETAPVVSVNTHMFHRKGTTGLPLPGIEVQIEKIPGVESGGKILVKGPNIMKGYLNTEPNTKFQSMHGWYDTGDIGKLDDDGYLSLSGRLKRFAKISGEMVSLTAVEEALIKFLSSKKSEDFQIAVIAIPDEAKGEKIVAFTNDDSVSSKDLKSAIMDSGLSSLSIPRDIKLIDEIPTLGTGKIDHKQLSVLMEPSA